MSRYEDWGKDSDYLEELRRVLENLSGFTALGQELLQNADDAGASTVVFDVTSKALVVDNDAHFSDCEHPGEKECRWRAEDRDRCDFHAFRRFSGASKRGRAGTTGAFGIGFTAVYQVTDRPELLSSGRHLVVDETLEPEQRIRACRNEGCDRPHERDDTRFILPWARKEKSALRVALGADSFTKRNERELVEAFRELIPRALLFLRHVREIELRVTGGKPNRWTRERSDRRVRIAGSSSSDWLLCEANFEQRVSTMRVDYPDHTHGRDAGVQVAIPLTGHADGRFYATLPTADETGLGFHINGEFFPTDDRRSLLWEGHPQADWNATAVEAAGTAIADGLSDLRGELGPARLWDLLARLKRAAPSEARDRREESLAAIWENVRDAMSRQAVVWTAHETWIAPDQARRLRAGSADKLPQLLCELGLSAADPSIAGPTRELGIEIGLEELSLDDLIDVLAPLADRRVIEPTELPAPLDDASGRALLLAEAAILRSPDKSHDEKLAALPLAPAVSGRVGPLEELLRLDRAGIALVDRLRLGAEFLKVGGLPETARSLEELAPRADCACVLSLINSVHGLEDGWGNELEAETPGVLDDLIRWFDEHQRTIADDHDLRDGIRALPIWPTPDGPRRLTEVTLPGGRQERLPLSRSLDASRLEDLRTFLRTVLGVKTLDLHAYCCTVLPARFREGDVTDEQRREVVLALGRMKGQLVDAPDVEASLRQLPLVECKDGIWRKPDEAYLASMELDTLLGKSSYPAAVLRGSKTRGLVDLLRWLGLTDRPRESDLILRIEGVTSGSASDKSRALVSRLLDELSARVVDWSDDFLDQLGQIAWLPCTEDREWHRPADLYQREHFGFFSSQTRFLDAPRQRDKSDFLRRLGIPVQPPVDLVIAHIIHAADRREPVPWGAYDYVERRLEDAELSPLFGEPCLQLDEHGNYARPNEVFVRHPFGSRRRVVPGRLRKHAELLERLGVDELPNASAALAVLDDIGTGERQPGDAETALACWRLIQAGLGVEVDPVELHEVAELPIVPDREGELKLPRDLLFDDDPALATRLGHRVSECLIPRQEDTWRAMEAAGVRHLSEAATPVLPGLRDDLDATPLRRRITERRGLIARIVDDAEPGSAGELTERLESLTFECSSRLTVRYEIDGDDGAAAGYPVRALYISDAHTLCVAIEDGFEPWSDIAKELGRALLREGQYRRIAGNLKAALEPNDRDRANEDLDALGVRRLEEATGDSAWLEADAEPVEEDVEPGAESEVDADRQDEGEPADEEPADEDAPAEVGAVAEGEGPVPIDGAIPPGSGGGTPPSRPEGKAAANGKGKDPSTNTREPGNPLGTHYLETFTIVTPKRSNKTATREELDSLQIDKAGVRAVLAFEAAAGRDGERKPHSNPGFDVESLESGEIVRTIEVKSLDAAWDAARVRLSDTQFETGMRLRDGYWLYVVENARVNPTIWCIQDPAGRVDRFSYVPEWKQLAEVANVRERLSSRS